MAKMKASLDGPLARIAVAEGHILSLAKQLDDAINQKPHVLCAEPNNEIGGCDAVFRGVPRMPLDYAIIVGMIAHNLRSALDGLAYQLTILNAKGRPSRADLARVMFPIRIHGPNYKRKIPDWKREPKFSLNSDIFKPVGSAFLARLEALQPYHQKNGGRKNPLWLLDRLNNTDKHREIVVVSLASTGITAQFLGGRVTKSGGRVEVRYDNPTRFFTGVPLEDGARVAHFDRMLSPDEMKLKMRVSIQAHFGDGCPAVEKLPVFATLRKILDHVRGIIEDFAPVF